MIEATMKKTNGSPPIQLNWFMSTPGMRSSR